MKNLAALFTLMFLLAGVLLFVPSKTSGQTYTICPNSGVECTVTHEDADGSTTTIETEKGSDDPGMVIEFK